LPPQSSIPISITRFRGMPRWARALSEVRERKAKICVARRELKPPTQIGVDETSFQNRYEYVTVVHDIEEEVVVHVAKRLGDVVDQVRRRENRELLAEGNERLKRTKYLWLRNPERMSAEQWREFGPLRSSRLEVARA